MQSEVRLIDANALEKDMRAYADNKAFCGHIELANGILSAVCRIDEAPTIDAVEVVRCKDCANSYVPHEGFARRCRKFNKLVCEMGFCSCGLTEEEYDEIERELSNEDKEE